MAKAIFTTKINPVIKIGRKSAIAFQEPISNQVRSAVGDYIIYYEPRRASADDSKIAEGGWLILRRRA